MLGVQASGKGTQASLLSESLNIPHISTGDILRQNLKDMTELGKAASAYINKGQLVPDEVIDKVVRKRLGERDCSEGFILDGYPRNISQADALESFAAIDRVIEIHISDREAVKRISGRRTCEKCGRIYSIYQDGMDQNNVCKECGGRLIIRDDDREEAIRKRLEIYHSETEPLTDYYRKKNILLKIDGERPIKEIFEDILKKLK